MDQEINSRPPGVEPGRPAAPHPVLLRKTRPHPRPPQPLKVTKNPLIWRCKSSREHYLPPIDVALALYRHRTCVANAVPNLSRNHGVSSPANQLMQFLPDVWASRRLAEPLPRRLDRSSGIRPPPTSAPRSRHVILADNCSGKHSLDQDGSPSLNYVAARLCDAFWAPRSGNTFLLSL